MSVQPWSQPWLVKTVGTAGPQPHDCVMGTTSMQAGTTHVEQMEDVRVMVGQPAAVGRKGAEKVVVEAASRGARSWPWTTFSGEASARVKMALLSEEGRSVCRQETSRGRGGTKVVAGVLRGSQMHPRARQQLEVEVGRLT